MGGGTPISPIPIHAHLTPYAYTNSNGSISSQNLDEDAASHNAEDFSRNPARDPYRNSRGGYFPDQLRPQSRASSRAPSSFRNSLMGAEDSALRGMYTIGPVIAPSRSVSPASTQYMNVHHNNLGAEDIALQRLGTPASTRPPSRTQNVIPNLKAHSMVDLRHAKPFHTSFAETSSRPGSRARSRSREPRSRLRSPSAMHGRSRSRTPMAFSGGHFGPQHGAASPAPCTAAPCSPSPTPDSEPVPEIRPCTAVARYDRNVTISQDITPQHVIPSLTVSYTYENLPPDWIALAHPEGALYWVHHERPIYTDAYLCERETLDEVNRFLYHIDNMIEEEKFQLPPEWELVLELSKDEDTGDRIWAYYFINHDSRALFWLHDFEAESILFGIAGVESRAHIHHELQSCYWAHWETFPHNREVPADVLQELLGLLVHAGIDSLTSPVSTSIYSEGDVHKILGFVKTLKSNDGNFGYAACVVGRLMSFYTHARFLNFYGQNGARLSRNQSVYYEPGPKPRSMLMLVSALLFFAPEVHLRGLENIYTDWVICQHMWVQFIGKLQTEWQEFILYATVLLNANVAFLAIPSVDPGTTHRTPTQIASYMSVITSIGSIITGLLLIRQHRTKREGADEVDTFLKSRTHPTRGFETLAIMYSLPYSLLMWAMMSFLVAFTLECLMRTADTYDRIPVVIVWALVGALVVWCVSTGWERESPLHLIDPFLARVRRIFQKVEKPKDTEEAAKNQKTWFSRIVPRRMSTGQTSTLVGTPEDTPNPGGGSAV